MVLEKIYGRMLDLRSGDNRIVREHGDGVGTDVHNRGDIDVLIEDAAPLPLTGTHISRNSPSSRARCGVYGRASFACSSKDPGSPSWSGDASTSA